MDTGAKRKQRREKRNAHPQRCSISGRNSDAINKEGANKQTLEDEKLAEQKRVS
jgi:hypothetical protein